MVVTKRHTELGITALQHSELWVRLYLSPEVRTCLDVELL